MHTEYEPIAEGRADADDDTIATSVAVRGERHAEESTAGTIRRIRVWRRADDDRAGTRSNGA
jgi:hypothetical protein